jgi:hypothetical protein
VRTRELGQIFNSLDPSPFTERDLDDDAEEYIVGWAREVDTGVPFRIVVHLPASEVEKAKDRGLESAIGNYFAYRVGMLERDLSDLFRVGRRSLGIGIAVLRRPTSRREAQARSRSTWPVLSCMTQIVILDAPQMAAPYALVRTCRCRRSS